MEIDNFFKILEDLGANFYTGVPDSLLAPFTDKVMEKYNVSSSHIVAANEGAAVGLAAGHYLATGRPAVVYMQNSGIGNAVNPICSLLHKEVYAIPVIFVIGWRGEPGTKDEPQHIFQGQVTLPMLECLQIPYVVVEEGSNLTGDVQNFKEHLKNGQSVAFVVRKDALANPNKMKYTSSAALSREEAVEVILSQSKKDDIFVCTTGKLSREVFEIREKTNAGHAKDFLTVGSMGHSISIAHGIAIAKPDKRVWCLDGDGAALMHMGSLAVTGVHCPKNLVHVVINNGAHETVGGLPTVSKQIKLCETAKTFGYGQSFAVSNAEQLSQTLKDIESTENLTFIEVDCNLISRKDLGRPTTTTIQNKNDFMVYLSKED